MFEVVSPRMLYDKILMRNWSISLLHQITHAVLDKELKHCRHLEDLEVNENVKAKAKDYVKKYMERFGKVYKKQDKSP